jgi:hypothetical protein
VLALSTFLVLHSSSNTTNSSSCMLPGCHLSAHQSGSHEQNSTAALQLALQQQQQHRSNQLQG